MTTLPPPSILIPSLEAYTSWYPGQDEAFSKILDWLHSPARFLGVEAPTGTGKSLLGFMSAHLTGHRAVYLTFTKGLQKQLGDDFPDKFHDIQGKSNYLCNHPEHMSDENLPITPVDEAPCTYRFKCPMRGSGCTYYDSVRQSEQDPLISTNYAYWMSQMKASTQGFGNRSLLILDEAHLALNALESHLKIVLTIEDFAQGDVDMSYVDFPSSFDSLDEVRNWASRSKLPVTQRATALMDDLEELDKLLMTLHDNQSKDGFSRNAESSTAKDQIKTRSRKLAILSRLLEKLDSLEESMGDWIWEYKEAGTTPVWEFTPLWPTEYAEKHLFSTRAIDDDTKKKDADAPPPRVPIKKILLMSAVLNPKTLDLLGIAESERKMISLPSTYPPMNTPIIHLKTVAMNHKTSDRDLRTWMERIDEIVGQRLDRKGIIFTVSYTRMRQILSQSAYGHLMMSHDTDNVISQVEAFKAAPAPAIFLSPAITSGWDFPDDECRYIILGKLPYPDTQSPVMQARMKMDKTWPGYLAMETLEQASGRGTRSFSDWCEVFIIDDSWSNWYWKNNRHFSAEWFRRRVVGRMDHVPRPRPLE